MAAWLRGVGIALRSRQTLEAGSYSSTVPTDMCGCVGYTAVSLDPGMVVAPPMTYIFSPTTVASAEPRLLGIGARAFQASAAGLYSHALSMGTHPGGPDSGNTKPPKA